jgi:hypothetical protein
VCEGQFETSNVAIISYDEKPGIQPIVNTAPTCRRSPASMSVSRATMDTNVTAR